MTEQDYIGELDRLGVDTDGLKANSSKILVMRDGRRIRGLYLNRGKDKVIYLTLAPVSTLEADPNLWHYLLPSSVNWTNKRNRNVVPRAGLRAALTQLLRPYTS